MARFLVRHKADYEKIGSIDKMVQVGKQVRDDAPSGFRWLNSWWDAEDEILFCDWEAPDEASLHLYLENIKEYWTVEKIYPVLWTDPDWYE